MKKMCVFSGPKDRSAQIAREQEEERAARVRKGTAAINQQFARFNDPFFGQIEQSALDFFNPQLQSQFEDTNEALIKNLARSGNLDASTGQEQLGDLQEALATQQARVADKARGIAQGAKADVESNRAALIQSLAATADPFAAANAAAAQAQALTAPPEFSPLGDVFTKFTNLARPQIEANSPRFGFRNSLTPLVNRLRDSSLVVNG